MSVKTKFRISKQEIKTVKKVPTTYLKEVAIVESEPELEKIIKELMDAQCSHFEVKNIETQENKVYKKTISGKNYTIKTC